MTSGHIKMRRSSNVYSDKDISISIQMCTIIHNYARRPCQLILLGDGLDEAVEAGEAGHQHQGEHGDHFHCAGEGGMFCESLTKNSEPYLQAPSRLFSGMVSSFHLDSSTDFPDLSTEDSFSSRLFLGMFVLQGFFSERDQMCVLLRWWLEHYCSTVTFLKVYVVFVTKASYCICLLLHPFSVNKLKLRL